MDIAPNAVPKNLTKDFSSDVGSGVGGDNKHREHRVAILPSGQQTVERSTRLLQRKEKQTRRI
jgi:hypothetical protein